MAQLKNSKHRFFERASSPQKRKEAIRYCTLECPYHCLGCAFDCKIRKHFKIAPHE